MKRICLSFLILVALPIFSFSQSQVGIANTWYQWPHESVNGTITYHTAKYLPVPGIDKQDEAFGMIVINSDNTCVVGEYCGYCPAVDLKEKKGTCKIIEKGGLVKSINIQFNDKTSQVIEVVSVDKDKLVISKK